MDGKLRENFTGSKEKRSPEEIRRDDALGKYAEFAIYQYMQEEYPALNTTEPDVCSLERCEWDNGDLSINKMSVSVKGIKKFSDFLLLPTGDHDIDEYGRLYDNRIGKRMSCLVLVKVDIENDSKVRCSIVGSLWAKTLGQVITNGMIIHKEDLLNGKVKMKTENYYVVSGDFNDFNQTIEYRFKNDLK